MPLPYPLFHISSAPGHKVLSDSRGNSSLSETPHIQIHAGPLKTDPVFGKGWYDGPLKSVLGLDLDISGKGMDERVELSATNKNIVQFDASQLHFREFTFGKRKYRLKVGETIRTEEMKRVYLHENARMMDGNRYYYSGLEIETLWQDHDEHQTGVHGETWRTVGTYTGARTSMRYNPKRILGIVRWNDAEWVNEEARAVGIVVILIVTEQA